MEISLNMAEQIPLNDTGFEKFEKDVLNQVMANSKDILETFKFSMIYNLGVSEKQNKQTIQALRRFRKENWDSKLSRDEAYKKYLKLY